MIGRIAIVALAAALSAWALFRVSWEPHRCNVEVSALEAQTTAAETTADGYARIVRARRNLARLAGLRSVCATEVRVPVLIAANEEILGRLDDAARDYAAALRVEQRPEIYLALGNVQVQLGQIDQAVDSYVMAVRFHPPVIDQIGSGEIRNRIAERLRAQR